jgi:hypothetical protein
MRIVAFIIALACSTCVVDGGVGEVPHDELTGDPDAPLGKLDAAGLTVEQATWSYCSTSAVAGLSRQLIEELECLRPGTIARIDDLPGVSLSPGTQPYLQADAVDSLRRAAEISPIRINSGLRTLAQQYLLFAWYDHGLCRNVVSLAAPPGRSNHESGLAIDVDNYGAARGVLESRGFLWLGASDPVHFDYVYGGVDLRDLSTLAFQRLYNRNNPPSRRIPEGGGYGYLTETALRESPAAGFPGGASCSPGLGAAGHAIEVYWSRDPDGRYQLRALGPQDIVRVEYRVGGYEIGAASRTDGSNFPTSYVFSQEGIARDFEVLGYDADSRLAGRGVGLIDVTANTAVYIKQMGSALYEVGLERAPAGVAAIEVRADGHLLLDAVSGQSRSPRNAVRTRFNQLGPRSFRITTFDADGSIRGNLYRTMTLE